MVCLRNCKHQSTTLRYRVKRTEVWKMLFWPRTYSILSNRNWKNWRTHCVRLGIILACLESQDSGKSKFIWICSRIIWIYRKHSISIPSRLMVAKILLECERLAGLSLSTQRKLVMDAFCVTPFDKDDELYQFEITAETLMTSKTPLAPIAESPSHASKELPDIFPMKCNISIPAGHLYKPRNIYRKSIGWKMYHFFFLFYWFHHSIHSNFNWITVLSSAHSILSLFTRSDKFARNASHANAIRITSVVESIRSGRS